MEYCVGSLQDMLKLAGGTIGENEIASVSLGVLSGLPLSFPLSLSLSLPLTLPSLQVLLTFTQREEFIAISRQEISWSIPREN